MSCFHAAVSPSNRAAAPTAHGGSACPFSAATPAAIREGVARLADLVVKERLEAPAENAARDDAER